MGPEGVVDFLQGAAHSVSLMALDLGTNEIGENNLLLLGRALKIAPVLREVYLDEGDNPIWRGYDPDDKHLRPVGYYCLGTALTMEG